MSLSLLATTPIPSATSRNDNHILQWTKLGQSVHVRRRIAYTICEHKQNKNGSVDGTHVPVIDRRNVLLGLGGMYGATTAATIGNQGHGMSALGAPIAPPDLSKCQLATDDETKEQVKCCPPYKTATIVDFKPPSSSEPLRVRKPAHKLTSDDITKFETAVSKMKSLDKDDPWNFMQQATIHCTYCNGAFNQKGTTDKLLQVHGSWFFLPWHRYYLYFWERILGKLIDDPTFAVPYWNWDTPKGMYMPKMYLNKESPLYDETRDKNHYKSVLDYNYSYENLTNPTTPAEIDEVTKENLCRLDSIFKESKMLPSLFMGKQLRAGEAPKQVAGNCENLHNHMHQWVGSTVSPHYNMGNFHTAARDTIFFGHHANIDRMWDLYNRSRGGKPEFKDTDWLESEFIFYDENREVVKVKVKDALTPEDLRYSYQPEKLPWKDIGPKCKKHKKAAKKRNAHDSLKLTPVSKFGYQPRALTKVIRAIVNRPKTSRSKFDKEDATEVLLINGIHVYNGTARFDVFVSKPIEGLVHPDQGEFAGSFVKIPHGNHASSHSYGKAYLELGISTLLEDIEAEDSESLVVTLVPRHGEVIVEGIEIELFNHEDDDDDDDWY